MKKEPIQIEDILTYKFPSGLRYSPDGKVLVFEVAYTKADKSGYGRDVWMVKDGKVRQLTASLNAGILAFEDNEHLLIRRVSENHEEGMTEIFRINVNGGEALPYLQLPLAVSSLEPAGKNRFVLTAAIERNDPDAYKDSAEVRKEKLAKKKEDADYHVVDEIPYWLNNVGFINGRRNALLLLENGSLKRLTGKDTAVDEYVIDGDMLYYTAETWHGKRAMRDGVYTVSLSDGKKGTLISKKNMAIQNLFLIDHQLYAQATDKKAYGSNETGMIVKVLKNELVFVKDPVLNLHTSVGSDCTMGGGMQNVVFKDELYSLVTDDDHTAIWKWNAAFDHTVLFDEQGAINAIDVRKDKVAMIRSDAKHLFEVYELQKGKLTKLTSLNDDALKGRYIAAPKRLDYTSKEEQLHGWVLLPQDFDAKKKYPAILDIHGGPRVVYGTNFFHEMQLWASRGFIVMFTNIRGSDGRGDEFADIRDQYGYVDYDNLMDFTDAVLAQVPAVDKTRLCVTGGSYGGFMTNWIIGHTHRFCCAVSQRSISNWISKALISDIGYYHNADQHGAPHIFDGFDHLWDHSPLRYAEGCTTPTLFIHSEEDYRCPLPEGMQMMQALAVQNVETRMVIFKGENHELSRSGKPLHRIRRLKEMTDWFEKHIGLQ